MTDEPAKQPPPDLRAVLRQAHIALCVVIAQENTGHDPSTYQVVGDAAKSVEAALERFKPPKVDGLTVIQPWPAQRCLFDAKAFNQRHFIGVAVRYWPVAEQCVAIDTVTRSSAWTLCGEPVVKIVGVAGGVALAHLVVLGPTAASIPEVEDELGPAFAAWMKTQKSVHWEVFVDAAHKDHGGEHSRKVLSAALLHEAMTRLKDARWLVHFMLAGGTPASLARSCIREALTALTTPTR